eukprot:7909033-Lingulodinium_polyedra.AAC.1
MAIMSAVAMRMGRSVVFVLGRASPQDCRGAQVEGASCAIVSTYWLVVGCYRCVYILVALSG